MSKFKFTWGHAVMLGLGAFMLFILTLIFLADESGDLVSDEYYEESLDYQHQDIDARQRTNALAEIPKIQKQANGYLIVFPADIQPDSGQIYMMRGAYKSEDISLPLQLNEQHNILIPAARMKPGEYDLKLSWYKNGELYLIKDILKWNTL